MANPKTVVIVVIITMLLVGGLGLFEGYRKGDLALLRDRFTDHEFPRAIAPEVDPLTTNNQTATAAMDTAQTNEANPTVPLKTNQGDIVIELYQDVMPITAGNFLSLAQKDFYDNTKFHRVIAGFMIQGGDPNSKTDKTETYGAGGPGYAIEDEFVSDARLSNVRGTIAMANSGPRSGGSQFFINLVNNTGLDFDKPPETSSHPVFGRVIAGMDIVEKIATVPTDERDMPLEPVVVTDVVANG